MHPAMCTVVHCVLGYGTEYHVTQNVFLVKTMMDSETRNTGTCGEYRGRGFDF